MPESDGRPLYKYRYVLAALPRTASTVSFHVAVASGDWTTIYHHEPAGSHSTQGRQGDGTQWTVSFTPAVKNGDGSTVFNVAYTPGEQDTRVIAVDTGGQEHTAARTEGSVVGDAKQLASTFQNLPLKQIKEVRFQARPYQLVEFRNVSLHPGRKTDVPIVLSADSEKASSATPPSGGEGKAGGAATGKKQSLYTETYAVGDIVVRLSAAVDVTAGTNHAATGQARTHSAKLDFDWLINMIFEKIAPQTWLHNGGRGMISHNEATGGIEIYQTQRGSTRRS